MNANIDIDMAGIEIDPAEEAFKTAEDFFKAAGITQDSEFSETPEGN